MNLWMVYPVNMRACYIRGPCSSLVCIFCSFFVLFVYPQTQTTHIERNALPAAGRLAGATPSSTPFFNLTVYDHVSCFFFCQHSMRMSSESHCPLQY
ncbi:hypothetical protein HanPSC8_Chr05g0209111 [Helianthus annuus]|nr:hypothetical protein HanPSC8_Chr05g0209111 [Helianthus annuus]